MSQIKIQAVMTKPNAYTLFAPNLNETDFLKLLDRLKEFTVESEDSNSQDSSVLLSKLKEESVSMNVSFKEKDENETRIQEMEKKINQLIQKVEKLEKIHVKSAKKENLKEQSCHESKLSKKIEELTEKLKDETLPPKRRENISAKLEELKNKQLSNLNKKFEKFKREKKNTLWSLGETDDIVCESIETNF
jgi:DNA repair exonuclease SbcCD ATPase subunit